MKEKEDAEDKANAAAKEEEKKRQEEETAAKMAELEAKMRAEAEEADKARKAMEEEYQRKLEEMKKMADAAQSEEEQKRKEMEMKLAHEKAMEEARLKAEREEAERQERIRREEAAIKHRQAEFAALSEKLSKIHPMVNEANLIGKELGRNVRFNVKMETAMPEFSTSGERKTELKVKVENKEKDYFYIWTCDKFEDRLAVMRNDLNNYFDTDKKPDYSNEDEDPFFDKPQPILVGSSYVNLKSLGYTLENEVPNARIISSSGGSNDGALDVAIWPCDAEGSGEPDDDLLVEDPKELLGKEMYFRVMINKAKNLPADLCKNVFVTYQFKNEPNCIYSTDEHPDMEQNPVFDYKHVHHVDCISDYILDYWENGNIACKVYAYPQYTMVKGKKKIV